MERRTEAIDHSLERLLTAVDGFRGPVGELCDHLVAAMAPPPGAAHDDIALIGLGRG